jgi:hypothetical protein
VLALAEPTPDRQSQKQQKQDNLVKDTNVSGDLIFAPVQIGTKIETQIVQISVAKVTQQPLIKNSPYQGLKRFNLKDEELFTICKDSDKRKNFIAGFVQVAKSGNSSVKIVLAMRSDFLEQLSFYPGLGRVANQNNIHLVTEMYPEELREAIEQPAAKHGVVFEEGLVKKIIEEVEGQKGYLPLLQYTLNLLWESECQTLGTDGRPNIEDRTLNKKSYAALEGVRGALQKHINEIYQNFNQDEQEATKQIFVKLVDIVDLEQGVGFRG